MSDHTASSISADAIKEIERLVLQSRRTEFAADPGDPEAYYIVRPDGQTDSERHTVGPHRELLDSIETFNHFITEPTGGKNQNSEVWVSMDRISFVYDNLDRRDFAELPLKISEPTAWLLDQSKKPLRQSEIVRALRIVFRAHTSRDSTLLQLLRQLKFTSNGAAEGAIRHGEESLGRSIVNAVTGQDAIPEQTFLSFPFFSNVPSNVTLEVAVEINASEQVFFLTPMPGELERGKKIALETIAEQIIHDRVFLGNPMPLRRRN